MNLVAKYVAGSLGNAMETLNVNEEWETKIKDKMPSETTKIIDAICQRFSNDGMLRTCKRKSGEPKPGELEPIKYMTDKSKELITDSISGDPAKTAHDLFLFVPTLPKLTQGGGGNNCTTEYRAKYVQTEQDKFLTKDNLDHYNKLLPMEIQVHKNSIKLFDKKLIGNNKDDEIKQFKTKQEESRKEISIKEEQQTLITGYDKNTGEGKEQLLKEFGKDTQTLEKEFNEKNKCKPEDSTETSNRTIVTDAASLAMNPYGKIAAVTPEDANAVMSEAKTGATDVQNTAKDAIGNATSVIGDVEKNAMDDARGSIPIATAVSQGDVGVNFSETPLGDMSLMSGLQGDLMKPREIKDGKAETILNYYTDHIINLLKCDEIVGETLQTKIIDTMFISINNNLKINKRELFSSIAKETTKHCIEKRIALIEPTINVYRTIVKTVPEQILPNYLHLILELFVYNCYNDLLDSEKLGFTTIDLSPDIEILKGVDGFEDKKKELNVDSIAKIMDLNKLSKEAQIPNKQTGGDGDYFQERQYKKRADKLAKEEEAKRRVEDEEAKIKAAELAKAKAEADEKADIIAALPENNQFALDKFIELFEEKIKEPEEKKGGARKKYTRKHKRHHKKRRSTRRYR